MEAKWTVGRGAIGAALLSVGFAGCSTGKIPPPAPRPPLLSQPQPGIPGAVIGVASWYGPGFNGRSTASGEIYDQEDMTAASNIFPLGTRLMVTNLANRRSVEVRINDRGPFRKGRKLDLSHAAARYLGIINPGTAPVRMRVLSTPPGTVLLAGGTRYWIQVGAFSRRPSADRLRTRLAAYYPDAAVSEVDAGRRRYYRVRMGGFPTHDAARERASALVPLGLPLLIVAE